MIKLLAFESILFSLIFVYIIVCCDTLKSTLCFIEYYSLIIWGSCKTQKQNQYVNGPFYMMKKLNTIFKIL